MREVYARLLDGSRFEEFKPLYGDKLVCGWASIHGFPVGVLGNNGILFSEEAKKGAQFIQLCNKTNTPLVFLHNITGFMVGSKAEQGGIIRNGAKLINAVSNSTVPHLQPHGRGESTAPATTAWPARPTTRASSLRGPTIASP